MNRTALRMIRSLYLVALTEGYVRKRIYCWRLNHDEDFAFSETAKWALTRRILEEEGRLPEAFK